MKDEELASRLGVNAKEVAKAANDLVRDQLVSLSVYLSSYIDFWPFSAIVSYLC